MRTTFETELRDKLNGMGAGKLPPSVYGALVSVISADIQAALNKSLNKRTSPKALARLFTECVTGKRERDSKGDAIPFGQLRSDHSENETETLIGAHSNKGDVSMATR